MGGGPVASGGIRIRELADGTRAFELRFMADGKREAVTLHERDGCECGCGGGWNERAARRELGNIQARVRAGVWKRDESHARRVPVKPAEVPTFHEYASQWLDRRADGVLDDRPLSKNSRADYLWRLKGPPPPPILWTAAAQRDRR